MKHWIVGLALLFGGVASAAIMKPMDLASLAQRADLVVLGRVSATQSAWRGGRIVTQVTLTPETLFKGEATGPVVVEVLGGEVDGLAQKVSGATAFAPDERAVVFLRASQGVHRVVGMAQGKLRVEVDSAGLSMVADLKGVVFARPDATGALQTAPAAPVRMPMARFAAELGRALATP